MSHDPSNSTVRASAGALKRNVTRVVGSMIVVAVVDLPERSCDSHLLQRPTFVGCCKEVLPLIMLGGSRKGRTKISRLEVEA